MIVDLLKRIVYRSGLLGLYHRVRNRNTLTVIMFHRVISPKDARWPSCDPDYTISDELFDACIGFFRAHYNIVSVEQVLSSRNQGQPLPPRSLLITFDDGWSDNAHYALPRLQKHAAPALLFAVADAINRSEAFYQEQLVSAWRTGRLSAETLGALCRAAGLNDNDAASRDLRAVRRLIAALETLTPTERRKALEPSAEALHDGLRHMISTEELRGLQRHGVAIGVHGKTHTPMTRAENIDDELGAARHLVAGELGASDTQVTTMSFPHGRWSTEIVQRARRSGYELMFTSVPGLNALGPHRTSCPDLLARLGFETDAVQDRRGRFRPDLLALYLFRRTVERLT